MQRLENVPVIGLVENHTALHLHITLQVLLIFRHLRHASGAKDNTSGLGGADITRRFLFGSVG